MLNENKERMKIENNKKKEHFLKVIQSKPGIIAEQNEIKRQKRQSIVFFSLICQHKTINWCQISKRETIPDSWFYGWRENAE